LHENKQIWNVKNLLNWATGYFTTRDVSQPRLSAELLLSDVLDITRMGLYLNFEKIPDENRRKKFREYIQRRAVHEPVQYILAKSNFRHLELYVDKNVLIPRPETELLVDRTLFAAFEIVKQKCATPGNDNSGPGPLPVKLNMLEVGTGSGAIAISLVTEIKGFFKKQCSILKNQGETIPAALEEGNCSFQVFATDNSRDALKIAAGNAAAICSPEEIAKIKFIKADIIPDDADFTGMDQESIDIVVSNPPYITATGYDKLPAEVKDFEPRNALLAGEAGTEVYRKIIKFVIGAKLLAKKTGCFIFESDPIVSGRLVEIIKAELERCTVEVEKDYNGMERIVTAKICL